MSHLLCYNMYIRQGQAKFIKIERGNIMNSTIDINHKTKTISFAKLFEQTAFLNPDSSESHTILTLRKAYPDYTIKILKNKPKRAFKGLSLEVMELYIERQEDQEAMLKDFKKIIDFYKGDPYISSKVKSWFLKKCPGITTECIEELRPLAEPKRKTAKENAKLVAMEKSKKLADEIIKKIDEEIAKKPSGNLMLLRQDSPVGAVKESMASN